MSEIDEILREIDAYIAACGMAPSTFGRQAVNDGKLVRRLRDGGNITLTVASRIRAYMADHPPAVSPFAVAAEAE